MIMEVCMDFIGLFFVASILSLSTAHFVETFRTYRPEHEGIGDEASVSTYPTHLWCSRSVGPADRRSRDYQVTLIELG
jgi:hypothetical protein